MSSKDDFIFSYVQTNINNQFCRLIMSRTCVNQQKYKDNGDLTQNINRIRREKIDTVKQKFENNLPPLYTPYHISIDVDVPFNEQEKIRELFLSSTFKLHPTISYNVSGVEGGVCVCTTNNLDRKILLGVIKDMGYPDNYMYLWEKLV